MKTRSILLVLLGIAACARPSADTRIIPLGPTQLPERAVRRDLPLGPQARRGYAAGTRDSSGAPGAKYWQQRVDYRIEASVTPSDNHVRGSGTITLHNTTPDTLKTIVLRLYQNYFTPRVARTDYVTDITEGIKLDRLSVNGVAVSLTDEKQYEQDERIAVITPSRPIMPGAAATLETAWRFAVPNVDTTERGERMGRFGNYLYQVAQWYPQIAMYDDLRGWDMDQYLGNGEFNNQFGSFDVKITAPGGWLVGATGALQNPEEVYSRRSLDRLALAMRVDTTVHVVERSERGGGATASGSTLTWHFTAPVVNDFAFALSRDYVLDATHARIPGKGVIPVYAFYLPQHAAYRTNNTVQVGRKALEHFSRALFPYEFAQGTIADGPETGMEYPMIIFNGSGTTVTIHEFGHQWFPMTVGSNETRYGFMDEGFDEYIDAVALAAITNQPVTFQNRAAGYRRVAGSELEAPMMWPTDFSGPLGTVATYSKAEVALNALGAIVGDGEVQRAMKEYAVAWRFKHPSPWDFFNSMNSSLKKDLDWFWYGWFYTNYTFDQGIRSVTSDNDNATVTIHDDADLAMPVIVKMDFTDGSSRTATFPADVWFAGSRTFTTKLPLQGKKLSKLTLDPENRFQDLDLSDNVWPR